MRWNIVLALVFCVSVLAGGCSDGREEDRSEFIKLATARMPATAPAMPVGVAPAPAGNSIDRLPERPVLADYLAYAALHNPGLEASFNRWKAALERLPQVRALPDPQFTYRYFIVEQAFRDGDMRNVYEISQTFPWLAKLQLRGELAAQEAAAARERFEAERLKLFLRVKQAYYEYYYISRTLGVTRETLQDVEDIERVAGSRYRTGTASAPDLLRTQVELGKLQDEYASVQDLVEPSVAKLNAAMNRPVDMPLPMPAQLDDVKVQLAQKELLEWLGRYNPELKALEHEITRERKSIDLARQDYFPDVTLGFEYDDMVDAAGLPGGSPPDALAVSASVNIPIWFQKYAAGVREARHRSWAASKEKTEKANSLAVDLKLAAYNFRNAERKIALYRDTLLPKARQSVDSIRAGYQTGTSGFGDLIDGQRILLEFRLAYERAVADRMESLAELEALVGRDLAGVGQTPASMPTTQP